MLKINNFKITDIFKQKISSSVIFSFCLFVLAWSLDYYITNLNSAGNFTLEANTLARIWWQIMGPIRFIEFPIGIAVVFCMTLIINLESKTLALLWLNFLAIQNFLGFLTWLPYNILDFLYVFPDWATVYAISLISIILSIPLVLLQNKIKFTFSKK